MIVGRRADGSRRTSFAAHNRRYRCPGRDATTVHWMSSVADPPWCQGRESPRRSSLRAVEHLAPTRRRTAARIFEGAPRTHLPRHPRHVTHFAGVKCVPFVHCVVRGERFRLSDEGSSLRSMDLLVRGRAMARAIASTLGYRHVDSGAMYRAVDAGVARSAAPRR